MSYTISVTKRTNGGYTVVTEDHTSYPSHVIYHGTEDGVILFSRGLTLLRFYRPAEWTIAGATGFTTVEQVAAALDGIGISQGTGETSSPVQATGTVALGTSRYIPTSAGVQMNREKISIQLLCANLSGDTTFAPEASADGTNWDVLTENDTDISHTLVDDAPFFRTYELDKGSYIRWTMGGATTGDVAYVINN